MKRSIEKRDGAGLLAAIVISTMMGCGGGSGRSSANREGGAGSSAAGASATDSGRAGREGSAGSLARADDEAARGGLSERATGGRESEVEDPATHAGSGGTIRQGSGDGGGRDPETGSSSGGSAQQDGGGSAQQDSGGSAQQDGGGQSGAAGACSSNDDCGADEYCGQGVCTPGECDPGATRCEGNAVATCKENGSGWGAPALCELDERCGDGLCYEPICEVDERQCQGSQPVVCNDSRSGFESSGASCPGGESCLLGECVAWSCEPDADFCDATGTRRRCDSDGLDSTAAPCPANHACDEGGCIPLSCLPDEPVCDGRRPTTCDASGTYRLGGTICAGDATCVEGECIPQICEPSTYSCDEQGRRVRCQADGLDEVVVPCAVDEFCRDGACHAQLCDPGQPVCIGEIPTLCNEAGSGYLDEGGACPQNTVCWYGSCELIACPADECFCDASGARRLCDIDGLDSSSAPCGSNERCDAGACVPLFCEPGQAVCDDQRATTCNASGTAYRAGGTVCSGGTGCIAGECVDLVCEPNAFFCDDERERRRCHADGLGSAADPCESDKLCEAGSCHDAVCEPSQPTCNGNVATWCNGIGSGYEAGGTDCAAAGLTCVNGTCSDSCLSSSDCSGDQECYGGECCEPAELEADCSLPSCGCAEGQVCSPDMNTRSLRCKATQGLSEGQPCTTFGQCAEGLECLADTCTRYCSDDNDCAIGGKCVNVGWADGSVIPGLRLCHRPCDPVNPQHPAAVYFACPEGYRCNPTSNGMSYCAPAGDGGPYYPCGASDGRDCQGGLYCSTGFGCRRFCYQASDCQDILMGCYGFSSPLYSGSYQVGYCSM